MQRASLLPRRLAPRWAWAALAAITLFAAIVRFWHLADVPPGFHYDEALDALEAWRVLTRPDYRPVFFPGDFGLPAMFIYLTSAAMRVFGQTPAVVRSVAALAGTLTIPAIYAFGQELVLADERMPAATPLLAAALLATLRWHLHFSRVGIEGILVPLFLTLILWALLRSLRTNRLWTWIVLGVLVGLSVYTYPAAWLLLPLLACVLLYLRLFTLRRLLGRARGLMVASVLAVVIMAPLAFYFAQHPAQVALRSSQVSILRPGEPLAEALPAIASNAVKTLAGFSFEGDMDPRSNVPGLPALDILMTLPFYIGLAVTLWHWRRPAFGVLPLTGVFMLATTVLSQYAPNFRRALSMTPLIALIAAVGLAMVLAWTMDDDPKPKAGRPQAERECASQRFAGRWTADDRQRKVNRLMHVCGILAVIGILLGSSMISLTTYFVRWGQSADLFYAYDQGLWEIGQYVQNLPQKEPVYLSPRPLGDATLAFAWREGPAVRRFDGRSALLAPVYAPETDQPATYIIIEHEDFRGARLLAEIFPQATEVKTFQDRAGKIYARAFHLPAGAVPARGPRFAAKAAWPSIELLGYDLNPATFKPGDIVPLQLWWHATSMLQTNWTVFTHLLGTSKADGSVVWAGQDAPPGQGSVPTTNWQPGDLILDEHLIRLPADMPAGDYQIEIGLYNPAGNNARAITLEPSGQDYLILGTVRVQ